MSQWSWFFLILAIGYIIDKCEVYFAHQEWVKEQVREGKSANEW